MTEAQGEARRLEGLSVLVVEDEAIVAMLIEELLEDEGCTVSWAPSIAEGCALAQEGAFDCAVVDRNLGGCDSAAVLDTLKARAIPVVIASGYALPAGKPPEMVTLRKPFTTDELCDAVMRAAGRR